MDQFVQVDTSLKSQTLAWKNYFGDIALSQSPVADTFQALAEKFFSACEDAGYPCPLQSKGMTQAMTETF